MHTTISVRGKTNKTMKTKFRVWANSGAGAKMFGNEEALRLLYNNAAESSLFHRKNVVFMQYTGMKDKQGKEVCEGDILDHSDGYCRVEYSDEIAAFGVVFFDRYSSKLSLWEAMGWGNDKICVVGNIYENPELAK